MSEIPDDVMEAAFAITTINPGDGTVMIAARAILAERERCAQIAESAPYSETDVADAIRGKP